MWRLILKIGQRVLASGPAREIEKYVVKNPGKTGFAVAALLDMAIDWFIGGLHRANTEDIEQLLVVLRRNIPSQKWSSRKVELLPEMAAYAKRGPAERAVMIKCMTEAGFELSLPPELINYLKAGELSTQDEVLLAEFSSAADSALPHGPAPTDIKVIRERVKLLRRAARSFGGVEQWNLVRLSFLTLTEVDIANAADFVEGANAG